MGLYSREVVERMLHFLSIPLFSESTSLVPNKKDVNATSVVTANNGATSIKHVPFTGGAVSVIHTAHAIAMFYCYPRWEKRRNEKMSVYSYEYYN